MWENSYKVDTLEVYSLDILVTCDPRIPCKMHLCCSTVLDPSHSNWDCKSLLPTKPTYLHLDDFG